MQQFNKAPAWLKIIIGLTGLLLIVALTIGVLYIVLPAHTKTSNTTTNSPAQPAIASAQKLIDAYKASSSIQDRDTAYKPVSTNPTDTYVQYTNGSRPYGITITTASYLQYQKTSTDSPSNSANLIASTESFLAGLGLTKSSEQTVGGFTSKLFEGSTVACQTDDRQAVGQQTATYGLACVDNSTLDSTYKQLSALINLTNGTLSSGNIKGIAQTDIVSGPNHLAVLVTSNKDNSSTTAYFMTPDQKTWNYIGDRTTPSVDVKDSFQIPTALQEAINSSPYKDFLTAYIK